MSTNPMSFTMHEQKIPIWSTAIDSDRGLLSKAHTSEADAWDEVLPFFTETEEECKKADEFIATGDFNGLRDFLNSLIEKYRHIDSYTIEKQELIVHVSEQNDAGVSENEYEYCVMVTVDVTVESPEEAPRAFIEYLGISQDAAQTLTFHISNLHSGDKWELGANSKLH